MGTERQDSEKSAPEDADLPPLEDVPALPVPPDGGWGWVVVAASFMFSFIVDGCCYSYGIFYLEYLEYFGASKAKTTLVGALLPGCYLLVGPFVSAMANKYGCRIVCFLGSILSAFAFAISCVCTNIEMMMFLYGVLGGVGFGMMYLPSVVIVSFYFDKKRALATGVAVCGSGVGTFAFAPLSRALLNAYGWKGANWIFAGIILNCCIFSMAYRPIEPPKPKKKKTEDEIPNNIKQSIIMQKILQEKERQRTISTGSLNNTVITVDNKLIKDPEVLKTVKEIIIADEQRQLLLNPPEAEAQNIGGSDTELHQITEEEKSPNPTDERKHSLDSTQVPGVVADLPVPKPINKQLARVRSMEEQRSRKLKVVTPEDEVLLKNYTSSNHSLSSKEKRDKARNEANRPMYRQDIFYSGSVSSLHEYVASNQDMTAYMASTTSIPPQPAEDDKSCSARCLPILHPLKTLFDLSLFQSPTFIMLLVGTGIFAFTGFFIPFMYIVEHSVLLGIDEDKATFLLSILGICNISGRLIAGWLADRPWADCVLIHNVCLIIAGLVTCLIPLFHIYALLAMYCVIFGSCIAAFIALRSIVPAELLGLQRLTNSFGLMLLFQGAAALFGAPVAGAIYDMTKSYSISFVAAGCLIAGGGFLCLPVRYISRWENKKLARSDILDIEMNNGSVYLPVPDKEDSKDKVENPGSGIRFQEDQPNIPAASFVKRGSEESGYTSSEKTINNNANIMKDVKDMPSMTQETNVVTVM